MEYTLKGYGWSMEAVGKAITDEQIEIIKKKLEEEGNPELWTIRHDFDELLGIDIWDGDLFHISKPLDNGTARFELVGTDDKVIFEFGIEDVSSIYAIMDNYDEIYGLEEQDAYPKPSGPKHVYLSIDESKGGLMSWVFESDEEPKIEDFHFSTGCVATPKGDWDYLDKVFFKGQPIEVYDWLDNWGKGATIEIYSWDDQDGDYSTIS